MRTFIVAALLLTGGAATAQDDRATFQEQRGAWAIVGDPQAGGCVLQPTADSATKMTIISLPHQETIHVSLRNPAWKSLPDDDDARIAATFSSASEILDSWSLAARFVSANNGGPRITFEIHRAANDNANFLEQMARSHRLAFWREGGAILVASFPLAGSAAAVDSLLRCRAMLRTDPDFDPFRK